MGKIKINYDKVYDASLTYIEEAEKILDIKNIMTEVYEQIGEEWKDDANNNFGQKFGEHIDKLDDFIQFLVNNSLHLNEISNKHKDSEDSFKTNIEKVRDLYEYRDRYQ